MFLYFILFKITMLGSYGLFTVVSHSLCEQRVPSAVMIWNFDIFWSVGEHGKCFPCFPILAKLCMNVAYAWYTLKSLSRCVQIFKLLGTSVLYL